jgi:hypothetical protein
MGNFLIVVQPQAQAAHVASGLKRRGLKSQQAQPSPHLPISKVLVTLCHYLSNHGCATAAVPFSSQPTFSSSEPYRHQIRVAVTEAIITMGSLALPHLKTGWHVDQAILSEEERVVGRFYFP